MNKEELLKAIEQKRQEIWPTDTGKMAPATVPNNLEQGWLNALTWMENLINSLPAKQESEDLFVAGADWQKRVLLRKVRMWIKNNFSCDGKGKPLYYKGETDTPINIADSFKKAMEDEPNRVNVEPPSFEESQGEVYNSYNVALNG